MQQPKRHQKTLLAGALLLAFLPVGASAAAPGYADVLKSLQSSYYGSSGIETIAGLKTGTASPVVTATTASNVDKTFHIGSQSKMFTSSALLYMMGNNLHGLSAADLNHTLAQIRDAQSDSGVKAKLNEIINALPEGASGYTLREFMSMGTLLPNFMTASLPEGNIWALWQQAGYGPVPSFNGNTWTNHLKLVELSRQGFPFKADPDDGFAYHYSNTNAVVLALMAEAVSGKNSEALINEYVVGKITGLNSANTYLSTEAGHAGMVGTEEGVPVSNLDPTIPWTSGAMVTNMSELLTFLYAINHTGIFLSDALTAARTAEDNMNTIPMSGMEISYGLGVMNLVWTDLLGAIKYLEDMGYLGEVTVNIHDVISTGHGGSIAGSSSFSGWLESSNYSALNDLGLAVYANSLTTIDKGGYFTATPSEALFVQAVEHFYRTARADGSLSGDTVTHGSTGGYITQTVTTTSGNFTVTNDNDPNYIAYLDLRGDPDARFGPFRVTLDPSYTFYSADTSKNAEIAITVGSNYTVKLNGNRVEGYGSEKTDYAPPFTLLKLSSTADNTIDGELAAYGENAIALSHTTSGGSLGKLTLAENSRLYSKGYNGVGLVTTGTVDIFSGSDGLKQYEPNFGITSAILAEGSRSIGIDASDNANVTLNPGVSVGAVTYAGFEDDDGTMYLLDDEFKPVDEKEYSVRAVQLTNSANLIVDGAFVDATARYFWNGIALSEGGVGTLAIGVELFDNTKLELKNGGLVSSSGYGVDFVGNGTGMSLTMNDARIWGTLATLHATNSSGNPTVDVKIENDSRLVGRVELGSVTAASSLKMTDSTLDFTNALPSAKALVSFGGSTLSVDASNDLWLPLDFGDIKLVQADNVNDLSDAFKPKLLVFGGDYQFSLSLSDHDQVVRYTDFTNNTSPNATRMFKAFAAYAMGQWESGGFSADGMGIIHELAYSPERLTAESYATQTATGMYLHSSVQGQVKRMIDATSDSQNPVSRLGQNTRSSLASRLGKHHNAHMQGEMWQTPALSAVNVNRPTSLHASGGTDFQPAYSFFGGYIHSERDQSSRKGYAGYDFESNGLLLGVTADPAPDFNLSFYAGTSIGESEYKHLASKIESDGLHLGALGRLSRTLSEASTLRLGVHLEHTHLKNESTRYTCDTSKWGCVVGKAETHDSYRQNLLGGGLDITLEQRIGAGVTLSPYAAFDALHVKQGSINEKGPNALVVKGYNFTQKYATLGLGAKREIKLDNGPRVTFGANIGWRHAFEKTSRDVTANFK
ncbi:MAG: autotransporter domain-containing protein, partial [Candidatus Accumulibacter sp.]|nr:autotransporter domain-containing protein [Accumulibacter sp.]